MFSRRYARSTKKWASSQEVAESNPNPNAAAVRRRTDHA